MLVRLTDERFYASFYKICCFSCNIFFRPLIFDHLPEVFCQPEKRSPHRFNLVVNFFLLYRTLLLSRFETNS